MGKRKGIRSLWHFPPFIKNVCVTYKFRFSRIQVFQFLDGEKVQSCLPVMQLFKQKATSIIYFLFRCIFFYRVYIYTCGIQFFNLHKLHILWYTTPGSQHWEVETVLALSACVVLSMNSMPFLATVGLSTWVGTPGHITKTLEVISSIQII